MAARKKKDGQAPRGRARRAEKPPNPRKALTDRQLRFVEEIGLGHSATEAAKRAGFSAKSAHSIAHDLMNEPRFAHVQAEIQRRSEERSRKYDVTADKIIQHAAFIAFGDLRELLDWGPDGITLKDSKTLTLEQAAMVQIVQAADLDYGKSLKLKPHNKLDALTLLAKIKGMLKDRVEHSGAVDFGPTRESLISKLDQVAAELAAEGVAPPAPPEADG